MKKPVRIIEILFPGSNSVLGTIQVESRGQSGINDYCWVILADRHAFDMLADECKELDMDEYILADRCTIRVKNSGGTV